MKKEEEKRLTVLEVIREFFKYSVKEIYNGLKIWDFEPLAYVLFVLPLVLILVICYIFTIPALILSILSLLGFIEPNALYFLIVIAGFIIANDPNLKI